MKRPKNSKDARRRKWFETGADAVAVVWPDAPRGYVCPLCGKGYFEAALDANLLTLEHAPPGGMGGRDVVLTCKNCDNRAGDTVDAAMIARESQFDFIFDAMDRPFPGVFEIGGERLNANIQRGSEGVYIAPIEANNNPEVFRRVNARMAEKRPGDEFTLTLAKGYHHQPAVYGLLRTAYLIAFASLGYVYAFSPQLRLIRQQLADIETSTIRVFSSTVPDAHKNDRRIMLVEQPSWLKCLAVQFGRHLVFLPWYEGGDELYKELEERNDRGEEFHATMIGKLIEWPRSPQHALDFNRPG